MVIERKSEGPDPDPTEFLFVSLETKRLDQTKPYDGKTACWVPCEKEGFVQGVIKSQDGDLVTVQISAGEEKVFKQDLVGQVNPPKYEKCEDMSNLTYLNDASVLHNLRQRYYNKLIYTYSGLFCVAINPYKRYPIYTNRVVQIYKGRRRNEVPPHIFAISDGAYCNMLQNHDNQSMLITGESGAGKTENTKKVIAYFANVGATGKKDDSKKGSLEDQIVQTNPVLEAFGNAKTTRNDNSSRFGKFIRIHFGNTGKLAGADIETYLLEKARVISQQPLERSYHIFYQLLSGAIKYMKDLCVFEEFGVLDFKFVSQGKTTIPGVDDGEEMVATDEAFDILGFTKEEKENVYRITACVMHMGQMAFKQKGREEQAEADGTEAGERVSKLLGIGCEDLYKNFLKPRIKVGTEFVVKGQNLGQVNNNVGAMAKAIFDRLFKFLVKKCNETLDTKQTRAHFIGVLDIAGFEIFDYNGFEQLCINFTNEKLQQFFNHHMFVLEQEEYQKEGIDWVFMDFGMDLQACIELMEKPLGLFSILEEESMFPKATDQTFDAKLKAQHLGKSPSFLKPKPPKAGQVEAHFTIGHYAGCVPYNLTGWLEKNKDPLNDSVVDCFKKGGNALIVEIFADHPGQSGPKDDGGGKGGRKKGAGFATVSSSYREQLNNLMATLKATSPHFIRCIIPNELKQTGLVDAHLVMHQLTCNGVLEGIRICRKGFPNRMMYPDFRHRYFICAPNQMKAESDEKKSAKVCFDTVELDPDKYRLGQTKVFFRAGVLGELEEIRDGKLGQIITWLQAVIRNYLARKEFQRLQDQREALVIVQRTIRTYMDNRTWPWYKLLQFVKPVMRASKFEDEMRALEEAAGKAQEAFENEEKLKKAAEERNEKLKAEITELARKLEKEKESMGDIVAQVDKAKSQKADAEAKLSDTQKRLDAEEESRKQLGQQKQKLEKEAESLRKGFDKIRLAERKVEQDRVGQDHQIRKLNEGIASHDVVINRLNKEKKYLEEQKSVEQLQGAQEKLDHLNKLKSQLEQSLVEVEESLENEKRLRAETGKIRRKVEGDLSASKNDLTDLERRRKELEQTIGKRDREISDLSSKLEDKISVVIKLQKQVKDFQVHVEEIAHELDVERQARSRTEKQRSDLSIELDDTNERIVEANAATVAQIELNKKQEAELVTLRRELEDCTIQQQSSLSMMRRKNTEVTAELNEEIQTLSRLKGNAEKEYHHLANELNDIRARITHVSARKEEQNKLNKDLSEKLNDLSFKFEDATRTIEDFRNDKSKLDAEHVDLTRQLTEKQVQLGQFSKQKVVLNSELDEAKRVADEESRERIGLSDRYRNAEHVLDTMKEQVDQQVASKVEFQRQIAKANADAQAWKAKYESEGCERLPELEDAKNKLQSRLTETELTIESLNHKVQSLEKVKECLGTELKDMQMELQHVQNVASQMEKKQKYSDQNVSEWKLKADDLSASLDSSQKDCRNYSTELFRLRTATDDSVEQLESVRRENKNLTNEAQDLMDQIGESGRNIHELERARRLLDAEKLELEAAIQDVESVLQGEEAKVVQTELELSRAKDEIEQRIREREEEFENVRKNFQQAIITMQTNIEAETTEKAVSMRSQKKLQADISQLEVAYDHSCNVNSEAQKVIKRHQQELKELQFQLQEEQREREGGREKFRIAERRAQSLSSELEESKSLLEQTDRARRQAVSDLSDAHDQIIELETKNGSLETSKRKLESEIQTLYADQEEILNDIRISDEKSKKSMISAARLADNLRIEQEHTQNQGKICKALESQVKELQIQVDEDENHGTRIGKKAMAKLEDEIRSLETELNAEQQRHGEAQKNARKNDLKSKELKGQVQESRKEQERLQDLIDKLQYQVKVYKRQIGEAEEINALHLAKFRKAQDELEFVERRGEGINWDD